MQRALISTHHLDTWAGSELVAIELAEGLISRDWEVTLHSPFWRDEFAPASLPAGARWRTEVAGLGHASDYDLVYAQHGALTEWWPDQTEAALFGADRPAFVFAHLAPAVRMERPTSNAEALLADLVLANSAETLGSLIPFGPPFSAAEIMPNPAPRTFETARRPRQAGPVARLLAVSNHLPKELEQALRLLADRNVEVLHLGMGQGGTSRRVQPEDLKRADAVVTIGKTVQYAFRAGCPVYCYDRFGGPGWLSHDNLAEAESYNFSGRCCRHGLDAHVLADELVRVPQAALDCIGEPSPERFRRERWIDRLTALLPAAPRAVPAFDYRQMLRIDAEARMLADDHFAQMRDLRARLRQAVSTNQDLRAKLLRKEASS